ncbi:MAG: ATP-grasp domain-containing protein [Firmicutes bacterium]|nr:ATP-grasp domain-containing protein [Bacillota bacterium]
MKGLILYEKDDAAKNEWFIRHMTELLGERGIGLELTDPKTAYGLSADFIINRSRCFEIAREFEKRGVVCINNSVTTEICNDKWKTYQMCREMSIPVIETKLINDGKIPEGTKYPCVLKSLGGHGGSEVFSADDEEEAAGILMNMKSAVVQRMCDSPGCDVRLYMLGGKVFAAVLRRSEAGFRSNFSLGGKAELFRPEAEQIEIAVSVAERLKSDYIGVDFIVDGGRWTLNEVEDAAGARMLYFLGKEDIFEAFAAHIASKIGL